MQVPPVHASRTVSGLASLHAVPFATGPSAGHSALPAQRSMASHCEADARHTLVLAAKPSAGQLLEVPEQRSATSHTPATARQVAPALPAACWHAVLEPSHRSVVQALPSSGQAVFLGFLASAGQNNDVPLHASS